jgi:hypothetical protein
MGIMPAHWRINLRGAIANVFVCMQCMDNLSENLFLLPFNVLIYCPASRDLAVNVLYTHKPRNMGRVDLDAHIRFAISALSVI